MADRRQVGISDGWRGQAPSRRKVGNRRSSCLRHHQRRLKTDPPGHTTERVSSPQSGDLSLLPATCRGTQNRPVTIVGISGHDAGIAGHDTGIIKSTAPEPPGPIAGTSGHDHRNTHTSLVGPFCSPRIRAPIQPYGSTAPNSRATPGMRALPNMKKKSSKGLCTAPRLLCHKPDGQCNSAHRETNLLFYIEFFVVPICGSTPGLAYSCGFGGDSPRFLTELSTVFVYKQFYPYKTMSYERFADFTSIQICSFYDCRRLAKHGYPSANLFRHRHTFSVPRIYSPHHHQRTHQKHPLQAALASSTIRHQFGAVERHFVANRPIVVDSPAKLRPHREGKCSLTFQLASAQVMHSSCRRHATTGTACANE